MGFGREVVFGRWLRSLVAGLAKQGSNIINTDMLRDGYTKEVLVHVQVPTLKGYETAEENRAQSKLSIRIYQAI